jgi:hypothetical protein
MSSELTRKPLHYDATKRRLWIRGQRCHHGATGAVMASAGVLALLTLRTPALGSVVAAGGVLMLHDWKDRGRWFARGWQEP